MSERDHQSPFAARRAAHLRLGRRGEALARRLLIELGLDVLVTNYRCREGEIDIVAREGDVLCFVEVKTRRRALRTRPAAAVGAHKQKRIIRAARRYLREIGHPGLTHRFDIVEIILDGNRVRDARLWRRAFTEERRRGAGRFPDIAAAGARGRTDGIAGAEKSSHMQSD